MSNRFEGKNAVVTGASRGIGAGIAQRLAAEGANVAIVARTKDSHPYLQGSLDEVMSIMETYGKGHTQIVADIADPSIRAEIIPKAQKGLGGPIDILVNNAAAAMYKPLTEYSLKHRDIMVQMNIHAPIDLAQAVLGDMKKTGEGWIVNLSSASTKLEPGPPYRESEMAYIIGMYAATKAALNRLTNSMAIELHPHKIRLNAIQPVAAVLSPGAELVTKNTLTPDQIESIEAMVEATIALCDCEIDRTGNIYNSLDLLDELKTTVMTLDGKGPFPGGYRPIS